MHAAAEFDVNLNSMPLGRSVKAAILILAFGGFVEVLRLAMSFG